jgi:hypothetical protein
VSRRKVRGRAVAAPSKAGLAFALGVLVMLAATTAFAKPARRQSNWGQTTAGNAATSVACAWSKKTLAGSLLIASVTYTGGTGTTVTAPGGEGWTLISAGAATSGTSLGVAIFYSASSAVHAVSSTETFALSTSSEAVLELTEFSGVVLVTPEDVSVATGGTAATAATLNVTPAGGASAELSFAVWGLLSATTTPGSPNGSFTKITSAGTPPLANSAAPSSASTMSIHAFRLLTPASGPITTTLSPSPAATWAGALVTFRVTSEYWIGHGGYPARPAVPDPAICYGYFDDDGCWSSTSGGVNDEAAPGNTDVVVFDGGGTGNVTFNAIDASQDQAYTMEIDAGYTGTMSVTDRAVSPDVRTTSTFLMSGGTFNVNGAQIQFVGATTLSGSATFNGGSGTETFGAALTVTQGTMTLGAASFSGVTNVGSASTTGVLTLGAGTASLPGLLNVKGAGSQLDAGSAALSISGAATVDNGGAINGQTATTLSFGGALTVTNGTVDLSTSTATPSFTGAVQVGSATTIGILKLNAGAVSFASTLDVDGAGSIFNAGSATLALTKRVTLDSGGTFTGGTANVTFGGAVPSTSNSIVVTNGTMDLSSAGTAVSSGTVTVTGGTMAVGNGISGASITLPDGLAVDGGTFMAGAGALVVTGATTVNAGGILNGGSNTMTFNGAVTVGSGGTSGAFNARAATNVAFTTTTKFQVASTFSGNSASGTFTLAPTLNSTGLFSVGDPGTSGRWTFTAGAHFNNMPVSFPAGGGGGHLSAAATTTFAFDGNITSNVGSSSTLPIIDCAGAGCAASGITVSIASTSVLNINGLEIDNSVAAGVTIASGATFTLLQRLKFQNNVAAGVGGVHLTITSAKQVISMPGCFFDSTAATNLALIGTSASKGVRALLEFQSTAVNGGHAGEAFDSDSDTDDDGVANTTASSPWSSIVEWVAATPNDTSGTGVGYPTAAFDWNTFSWYGVYAAYKDTAGAGTADVLWLRNADGSAGYSFSVPDSSGNIVGTPWWDTVNETLAGVDANGDGDTADTDVHVVYVGTSGGHIIKLVDNGASLARPAAGAWSTDFTSTSVATITSPLIEDGTNLYFGGTDATMSMTPNQIFAVQIVGGGSGEKALVREKSSVDNVTAAPSWAVYSGHTYLFVGSAAVSSQAYIYQVDITANTIANSFTGATFNVNDSVRLINNRAYAVTDGGKLFFLNASNTTAGGFTNLAGSPYISAALSPIKFAPYIDSTNNSAYFGDNAGNLYVVTSTGANFTGYPFALLGSAISSSPLYVGTGVIAVGGSDGFVYFVDRHNASNAAALFKRYYAGTGTVSSIAYNANTSAYMVSTSDGKLIFIKASDVPDPTASNQ